MSPIDDELRSLLQSRASALEPAPDPLGGIETRAGRIRRRRTLASVSAAAAVAVAVAVAVPLVTGSSDGTAVRQPVTTAPPTHAETPYRPANLMPWERQSALELFGSSINYLTPLGTLLGVDYAQVGYQDLWTGRTEDSMAVTVGEVWTGEGAARLATVGDGPQLGPTVDPSQPYVAFAVGKTKGTLVVVAAPDTTVEYSAAGDGGWQQISGVGQAPPGVGLVPLQPLAPHDQIRLTLADGKVVTADAPDWTPPQSTSAPVNLLSTWAHRGEPTSLAVQVMHAFGEATGRRGVAEYRPLYDGTRNGLGFTIGQAWNDGDDAARTVAYDTDGTFFLGPVTLRDPWVLAGLFSTGGKDLLVLLPRPGAGRVGYSPDATSPFTAVASGRSDLDSVGLVDRDPKATADRVQVHQGDDSVVLTAPVASLTCGAKECG